MHLSGGSIVVTDWRGDSVLGVGDPVVRVVVHDRRFYGALRRGSVGLGESYASGWWDCDDLTGLLRLLDRSVAGLRRELDRLGAAARPLLDVPARRRRPNKEVDRRNVRSHYDLGNGFFSLMLDPTMTYSCALFDRPGVSLADAQTEKLDRICRKLALSPQDHVVEIGTGWGSFAMHAASRYGCRVTTTTVSAAQHDYARELVSRSGLASRVTVLDADYRDLSGTFDRLVSIEMIEAVDWREYPSFFSTCARLLGSNGLAALQAIVIADESFDRAKYRHDVIRRRIFPGACLPSVSSIVSSAGRAGLRAVDLRDIGGHYAETLRRWRDNLRTHETSVQRLGFDAEFRRLWEFYLAYGEAAFVERHISDVQLVLAKGRAGPAA